MNVSFYTVTEPLPRWGGEAHQKDGNHLTATPPHAGAPPPFPLPQGWAEQGSHPRLTLKHNQSLWNPAAFGWGWGGAPLHLLYQGFHLSLCSHQAAFKDPGALDPAVEQMETIKPFAEKEKRKKKKWIRFPAVCLLHRLASSKELQSMVIINIVLFWFLWG